MRRQHLLALVFLFPVPTIAAQTDSVPPRVWVDAFTVATGLSPNEFFYIGDDDYDSWTATRGPMIYAHALWSKPAGRYGLHMIPTAKDWTIIFSANFNNWGSFSYDEKQDVLRFPATPRPADFEERLEYRFENLSEFSTDTRALMSPSR